MKRILITGAAGFIGSSLIRFLQQDTSLQITGLVRQMDERIENSRPGLTYAAVDLRDAAAMRSAVQDAGPDHIIHLAAAGVRDPFLALEKALDHNLQGTINLLSAAFERQAGPPVKKVIVCRTPGERTAMNHYAASKAAAWLVCRMYARTREWPVVGGMIFQVYGPGQSAQNLIPAAFSAAREDRDFPMTEGLQRKDWIYIDDVVAALVALLTARVDPGQSVDIGTGETVQVAEAVRMVYRLVGGKGRPLIGAVPSRPGEEYEQTADVSKAQQLLDWQASYTLENGLKQLISYR